MYTEEMEGVGKGNLDGEKGNGRWSVVLSERAKRRL